MFGWSLVSISRRILNLLETNDIKMYTMTSILWILCQATENQLSSLSIPLCQPDIPSNILCLGTPQPHGTGTQVGDFHSCSPLEIFQSHLISQLAEVCFPTVPLCPRSLCQTLKRTHLSPFLWIFSTPTFSTPLFFSWQSLKLRNTFYLGLPVAIPGRDSVRQITLSFITNSPFLQPAQ